MSHFLVSGKKSYVCYDEYLHIGCDVFFNSFANAAIFDGLYALPTGPTLSQEQKAAVALIIAGNRTHLSTKKAARIRLGFFRLIKGGQKSSDSDRVHIELAHIRFCRLIPAAVTGTLDALRQAFVDRTLEVNLHGGNKVATRFVESNKTV
jgi:hypothetical protein